MRSQEVSVKRDPEVVRVFRRAVLPLMMTAVSCNLLLDNEERSYVAASGGFSNSTGARPGSFGGRAALGGSAGSAGSAGTVAGANDGGSAGNGDETSGAAGAQSVGGVGAGGVGAGGIGAIGGGGKSGAGGAPTMSGGAGPSVCVLDSSHVDGCVLGAP